MANKSTKFFGSYVPESASNNSPAHFTHFRTGRELNSKCTIFRNFVSSMGINCTIPVFCL